MKRASRARRAGSAGLRAAAVLAGLLAAFPAVGVEAQPAQGEALADLVLYVRDFELVARGPDGAEQPVPDDAWQRFRARFGEYLVAKLGLTEVVLGGEPPPGVPAALIVSAMFRAERVLDAAQVSGVIVVRDARGAVVDAFLVEQEERSAASGDQGRFTRAFALAYVEVAERLKRSRRALLAAAPWSQPPAPPIELPLPRASELRSPSMPPGPETIVVDGREVQIYEGDPPRPPEVVGIIWERPPRELLTWYDYVRLLGGVEVMGLFGQASVSSSIQHEGEKVMVASGEATRTGVKVQLYSAPSTTRFFVLPALGYLYQEISIHDFAASVPEPPASVGIAIPTTCALRDGGGSCDAPNVYDLIMQSGFLGAVGGADLVLGASWWELFLSASLTVNALEYRDIRVRLGEHHERDGGFAFFRSGSVGVAAGLRLPRAHLGLRLSGSYEHYFEFAYGEPIEFAGPVELDPEFGVYRRKRSFVRAASLGSFSGQVALAVLF